MRKTNEFGSSSCRFWLILRLSGCLSRRLAPSRPTVRRVSRNLSIRFTILPSICLSKLEICPTYDGVASTTSTSLLSLPSGTSGRTLWPFIFHAHSLISLYRAPYLVVLTNRGKDLRFYKATQIRVNDEVMRNFLIDEGWRHQKPWKSAYSPGGSRSVLHLQLFVPRQNLNPLIYREWVMEYLAIVLTTTYVSMLSVPKWLLYLITGGIGSVLIGLMHKSGNKPAAPRVEPKVAAAPSIESVPVSGSSTATTSPKSTTKRGGAKSKKTTKK